MATYFAWVDPTDSTFGAGHLVVEPTLVSYSVTHREGDVATLTAVLKNPRIGLLNAGRKLWVWLSEDIAGTPQPAFFGRLVGIPENVFAELVTLVFIAKPDDYEAQRLAVALTYKELPWFDPVFVDSSLWSDPDAIVETRTGRWHVSRGQDGGPLTVTLSEIVSGEDGNEIFLPAEIIKDSVSLTIDGPPLTSLTAKATVTWDQSGFGGFEMPVPLPPVVAGFNESIYSEFPKAGGGLGGGWSAGQGTRILDIYGASLAHTVTVNFTFHNTAKSHTVGDVMSSSHSVTDFVGPIGFRQILTQQGNPGVIFQDQFGIQFDSATLNWQSATTNATEADDNPDINIPAHYSATYMGVVFWQVTPILTITPEGSSVGRTESVEFTMVPDIQAVLTVPDAPPTNPIKPMVIQGADVGKPIIGEGGTVAEAAPPIGDTSLPNYFPTTRGLLSLEYCTLKVRAQLRSGARIARCSWGTTFDRAFALTCRKSAQANWHNLPGGQATGKIVEYTFAKNVSTGQKTGSVTVLCTIGHDGTITSVTNVGNDYVVDEYVNDGYVVNSLDTTASAGSDFGYSVPVATTSGGALGLDISQVFLGATITGDVDTQLTALEGNGPKWYISTDLSIAEQIIQINNAEKAAQDWLDSIGTKLTINLKPITGSGLEFIYPVTITPLKIEKTIDFEAGSTI